MIYQDANIILTYLPKYLNENTFIFHSLFKNIKSHIICKFFKHY